MIEQESQGPVRKNKQSRSLTRSCLTQVHAAFAEHEAALAAAGQTLEAQGARLLAAEAARLRLEAAVALAWGAVDEELGDEDAAVSPTRRTVMALQRMRHDDACDAAVMAGQKAQVGGGSAGS